MRQQQRVDEVAGVGQPQCTLRDPVFLENRRCSPLMNLASKLSTKSLASCRSGVRMYHEAAH